MVKRLDQLQKNMMAAQQEVGSALSALNTTKKAAKAYKKKPEA